MDLIWEIMEDYLHFATHAHGLRIQSFVLMNNHFHLLATAPDNCFAEAMQYLLTQTSKQIGRPAGRRNHLWKSRYFRCRIGNERYLHAAYKYFYRNPVEAGIVKRVEDYPYSTLRGLLGLKKLTIPVVRDDILFPNVEETLAWLNTSTKTENREAVRKALRRAEFKFPNGPTGRRHKLEDENY